MSEADDDTVVPEPATPDELVPPPEDVNWLKLQIVRGVAPGRDETEGHQPGA